MLNRDNSDARTDEGISLIEMVVATALLAVLMAGIGATLFTVFDVARSNRHRVVAANLASREIDAIRATDFEELEPGHSETTETLNGIEYTVARDAEWVPVEASSSGCQATGDTPAFMRYTVSVTWPDMGGLPPAQSDTILSPPVGAYDPSTGHVAVTVLDGDAQPVVGLPVDLEGNAENRTVSTTNTGCAFFDFLDEGTYTVTAGDDGFVDLQGEADPQQTASVTVGATTPLSFVLAEAATLEVSFAGATGGMVPASLPIKIANTGLQPTGTALIPAPDPPVSPQTVGSLFPYESGYEVWAGNCADADPATHGDPTGGGTVGQREPPWSVSAGEVTTATVTLGEVRVLVQEAGTPVVGAEIVVEHAPDPESCDAGESYTIGPTDATGALTAALPYGEWDVRVLGAGDDDDDHDDGAATATVTIDPTVPTVPEIVLEIGEDD